MSKKILSLVISVCLLLSVASSLTVTAEDNVLQEETNISSFYEKRKFPTKKLNLISNDFAVENVGASGTCGENVSWSLSSAGNLTISGSGYMYDYSAEAGEFAPWIESYESIKSITIKSGVQSIGDQAFAYCINLTSVSIAPTVEYIGAYAFESCESLTSLLLPTGVMYIGDFAFMGTGIKSLNIPLSVVYIGSGITAYCPSLKKIIVNSDNTYYEALSNCLIDKETNYIIAACEGSTFPEGDVNSNTYSIDSFAFAGVTSLTSLNIPANILKISEGAFIDCVNISSITVDSSSKYFYASNNTLIEKNSKYVVLGCKNSTIPNDGSIFIIKGYAFYNCDLPSDFTIPKSVNQIGEAAFYGCSNLYVYSLRDNITKIGAYAFDGTKNYNTPDDWEDGVLYIGKYAVAVKDNFSLEYCKIKEGTTLMADSLFAGQVQLKKASFPESLESISDFAFSACVSLEKIEFSPLINTIGEGSFYACISLTSVILPEFLVNIKTGAFSLCTSLSEVVIPKNLQTISEYAFFHCPSLNRVTVKSSNVKIGEYALGYNIDEESFEIVANPSFIIVCPLFCTATTYASQNKFTTERLPKEVKDPLYINARYNTMPNIPANTDVNTFKLSYFEKYGVVIKSITKDGKELDNKDIIGTGCVIETTDGKYYTAIINGDTDGNGKIDATDYLRLKKAFLGELVLEGVFITASDTNDDGTINSTDYLQIKNYFLGKYDLYS